MTEKRLIAGATLLTATLFSVETRAQDVALTFSGVFGVSNQPGFDPATDLGFPASLQGEAFEGVVSYRVPDGGFVPLQDNFPNPPGFDTKRYDMKQAGATFEVSGGGYTWSLPLREFSDNQSLSGVDDYQSVFTAGIATIEPTPDPDFPFSLGSKQMSLVLNSGYFGAAPPPFGPGDPDDPQPPSQVGPIFDGGEPPTQPDDFNGENVTFASGEIATAGPDGNGGFPSNSLTLAVDPDSIGLSFPSSFTQKSNVDGADQPPSVSDFFVGGDRSEQKFNNDWPTVVFVHGRQPSNDGEFGDAYTGDPFDIPQLSAAYRNVKSTYPNTNALLVTWEAAFVGTFLGDADLLGAFGPAADTYAIGPLIAEEIASISGDEYDGKIHLVGHSYGSVLNNTIGPTLKALDLDVAQITVLDAPTKTTVVRPGFYEVAATASDAEFFDNYYGSRLAGLGGPIPAAEPGGGQRLPVGHSEVFDRYVSSIADSSVIPHGGGFQRSVAAVENIEFDLLRPEQSFDEIILAEPFTSQSAFFNNGSTIAARMEEGSDSFFGGIIEDLLEYDAIGFNIDWLELGEEDWFEVMIDDFTIAYWGGGTIIQEQFLLLSWDASRVTEGRLSFLLSGRGDVDASASVSNLRGYRISSSVPAPVALPPAGWMLVASVAALPLLRRKGQNRAA